MVNACVVYLVYLAFNIDVCCFLQASVTLDLYNCHLTAAWAKLVKKKKTSNHLYQDPPSIIGSADYTIQSPLPPPTVLLLWTPWLSCGAVVS
jgi:hypothetical protein